MTITAAGEQKRTRLTIYPFSERFGMATLLAGTMEDCLDQGRTASNVDVPLEEVVAALTADVREWALFGCSVPHELGSLVAAISASSRTLEETEGGLLSPQGRGYLHLIQKAAAQMSEISRALLTIAPLSSRPLVTQTTDLTELAWSAIEQLRSTDTTRKVTFKVQPDLHADGEPQLLARVLCNLLSNAWKFTETEDAAVISLRGKQDVRPGPRPPDRGTPWRKDVGNCGAGTGCDILLHAGTATRAVSLRIALRSIFPRVSMLRSACTSQG